MPGKRNPRTETHKRCGKCSEWKVLTDFYTTKKNGKPCILSYCKVCSRKTATQWAKDNPDKARQKSRICQQKKALAVAAEIRRLKDVPCKDCRQTFPPYVMDFDHVVPRNGDTSKLISQLTGRGNVKKLHELIKECEVVCANCHRIRTHNRKNPQ